MEKPNLHPHEEERLNALERLSILDTISEREFDEITLIASQICNTPIALISLVDDKRQWFKSKVGLNVSETSKDLAFCAHAILQAEVFIVPDSSKDERFFDNPLATGAPYVKFYAGAPLLDPNTNLPIGTLCVIDDKPRTLESAQISALKALSNQINKLLELKVKVTSLISAKEQLSFQKTAFDNISEGVVLQDNTGKIVEYNNAALEILALRVDPLFGTASQDPDWHAIREDGTPFPAEEHPAMVAIVTAKPLKNVVMGIETKYSEVKWISVNSTPLFLNVEKIPSHSVTTFADITKEKKIQQALFQSAKMTSLGEMAGGIAHEINTPLAIILSATNQIESHLKIQPPEIEKTLYKVKKIETTALRISQIVRGLRTFSRNSFDDPWQIVSIRQIVSDTISLCNEKFKYGEIKLEIKLSEDAFVNCIAAQISQVVLNILNNAYDATLEQSEKWVRVELEQVTESVRIRITDSGSGISPELVSKIMQPFFTTKQVGKGTGLGLSISKGITESFNGRLYYEKHIGKTSFVIELPKATADQKSRFF